MDHDGETMERREQRRSKATSGNWDTATRQAEWHASAASAVNSTTYGKVVARIITAAAEAGDTAAEAERTEMTKTPTIVKPGDVTSNEWERRRTKVTLNTWDFLHAATTKQPNWHTSTAASSSENDTGRARAPIETTGGNKGALRGDLRVVPDNMATIQKTDQDA